MNKYLFILIILLFFSCEENNGLKLKSLGKKLVNEYGYISIEIYNPTDSTYFFPSISRDYTPIFQQEEYNAGFNLVLSKGKAIKEEKMLEEWQMKKGRLVPATKGAYYIDSMNLAYDKNIIESQKIYKSSFPKKDSTWLLKHYLLRKNSFILQPHEKKKIKFRYIPLNSEISEYVYLHRYDIDKEQKVIMAYKPIYWAKNYMGKELLDSLRENKIKIFDKVLESNKVPIFDIEL